MKPSQLGAQMYSFREFIKTPEEVRSTLREIRKMGYEAVQLSSSIAPMPNAELSAMLKENNLIPCSSHDPADRILEVPEEIGKRLQELSCPHCAVPFPPYTFPASEEEVVNLAKKINQSAQVLRRFGVTLSYHNHSQEFQHFNGKRMLDNACEIVMKRSDRFVGPGHNSDIITDKAGDDWLLYHAVDARNPRGRKLLLDKIRWVDDWPTVQDGHPSETPQPTPLF